MSTLSLILPGEDYYISQFHRMNGDFWLAQGRQYSITVSRSHSIQKDGHPFPIITSASAQGNDPQATTDAAYIACREKVLSAQADFDAHLAIVAKFSTPKSRVTSPSPELTLDDLDLDI